MTAQWNRKQKDHVTVEMMVLEVAECVKAHPKSKNTDFSFQL